MHTKRSGRSRLALAVALALTLTVSAAAIGGSAGATPKAAVKVDKNAILRMPLYSNPSQPFFLDPTRVVATSYVQAFVLIYGTPIKYSLKLGTYEPWLAQSWKVVDPTTFELNLRPNLTFHDGTPYNAANFKLGFQRTLDIHPAVAFPSGFHTLVTDIVVEGATKLTFKFSQPVAGSMVDILARTAGMVASPNAKDLNKDPIGAGPFKVDSYTAGGTLKLSKFDNFFQAKKYKIAGVELSNVTPGQSVLNALQANQIDIGTVDTASVTALKGQGFGVALTDSYIEQLILFNCLSRPPFDDVRVRRAIQAVVDRKELLTASQAGLGKPLVGSWPVGHQFADPDLEKQTKPNVKKAKALLAEAGVSNLTFNLGVAAALPQTIKIGEVLQQQLAEIGVKMNLDVVNVLVADYVTNNKGPSWESNLPLGTMVPYLFKQPDGSFTIQNPCKYDNTKLSQLWATVTAKDPGDPSLKATWKQITDIIHDEALQIPLYKIVIAYGYNKRVHGVVENQSWKESNYMPVTYLEGVFIEAGK